MTIYKISPNLPYLEVVAEFILDKFYQHGKACAPIKVILPRGFVCQELQKILVQKQEILILPDIILIDATRATGCHIFDLSPQAIQPLSIAEETLIIAEIVSNYPELKFDLDQSLKLSPELRKLFHELTYRDTEITILQNQHHTEHWHSIYELLAYAHNQWRAKLRKLGKCSSAESKMVAIKSELQNIKDNNINVIVAGIDGFNGSRAEEVFLTNLAAIPTAHIILPPTTNCAWQYFVNPCFDISNCEALGGGHDSSILDALLLPEIPQFREQLVLKNSINYMEFEDIYQETEQISLLCKKNPDKKIAIIIDDIQSKETYCHFLLKHFLEFDDTVGSKLVTSNIAQMLFAISEISYNKFSLQNLFLLLGNPLIQSRNTQKLELLLSPKHRFVSSWEQLLDCVAHKNDEELLQYCINLNHLFSLPSPETFNLAIKHIVRIAEALCSSIWHTPGSSELSEFLVDLIKIDVGFSLKKMHDFPKVFYSLMANILYFGRNVTANIVIAKAETLPLLKFDLVFLAQCNNNNWPLSTSINPYLSKLARTTLRLNTEQNTIQQSLYYFYLYLHNEHVIITRAKKMDGKVTIPSNFLLTLQLILGKQCTSVESTECSNQTIFSTFQQDSGAFSTSFPNTLSITDIETLIRSPYSFYAKKILNLRKQDRIWLEPQNSEFGNFIHKSFDHYSKLYDKNRNFNDMVQALLDIGSNFLVDMPLPEYTKKMWHTKLVSVAEEFITFDEQRRSSAKYTYTEVKGELQLKITGHELKIIGVLDRIEIDRVGCATILDYKTGSLPSKKDIISGLSPQLIIMALMTLEGSLKIPKPITNNSVIKLVYVKISSSLPRLQTVEISFSREELQRHAEGLTALLEYYIVNKYFPYNIDLLSFNDYQHLKRDVT